MGFLVFGQGFLSSGDLMAQETTDIAVESNVSNLLIAKEKTSDNLNACVEIINGAFSPCLSNPGTIEGIDEREDISSQMSVYVVRKGDNLDQIAKIFGVSANTILWMNDMKKGDKIKEGDILLILPIDGAKHTVAKGDTLSKIAEKYKVEVSEIISFNDLPSSGSLVLGKELIIPNADIDAPSPVKPSSNSSKNIASSSTKSTNTKSVSGYFINPVPSATRTQGLHGNNSVDLAAPIGTPILASASGTVLIARYGWNGAYGNMIIIQHPNGTKTLYSHLSEIKVSQGNKVSQGQVIGKVGNTGRVRASKGGNGAHLHFEVHGAKNPGATTPMSWAK